MIPRLRPRPSRVTRPLQNQYRRRRPLSRRSQLHPQQWSQLWCLPRSQPRSPRRRRRVHRSQPWSLRRPQSRFRHQRPHRNQRRNQRLRPHPRRSRHRCLRPHRNRRLSQRLSRYQNQRRSQRRNQRLSRHQNQHRSRRLSLCPRRTPETGSPKLFHGWIIRHTIRGFIPTQHIG